MQPLAWEIFAQGEYIGPARLQHVPEYYLRVDDQIGFVFRVNGKPTTTTYRLNVGDVIRVSSLTMPNIQFDTPIEPDGKIILPQVGPVMAAGKSMETLRIELDERFRQFLKEPSITVIPVTINKTLEELRTAVTNRNGIFAGQAFHAKVSPDGTVQLPAIGSVPAQGLTLGELRSRNRNPLRGSGPGIRNHARADRPGTAFGLCPGRSAETGQIHPRCADDRDSGTGDGRQLEHRRQSQTGDCLSPGRRMAADGDPRQHPARPLQFTIALQPTTSGSATPTS